MNKRIKELAKQAGGNPNYKAFRGHFLPPSPDYIDPATVDLEKFAELIVRECIRVPYDMWDKAELNADVAVKIDHRIKEHFGVKE